MGGSTKASGSGATETERAIGRAEADTNGRVSPADRAVAPEPERFDIRSPARGGSLDIELHEAPSTNPGLRNRVMTPECSAAEKRPIGYSRDVGRSRRTLDGTGGDVLDNDGTTTCSMVDLDQNMDSLDGIDRRMIASVIMSVDVTEVLSSARVSRLASKFGLVPGASLDLTNGWNFKLRRRSTQGLETH